MEARKDAAAPLRITQFYTTAPKIGRGEKTLLCYGVENAKSVWLSPPRRELSAALARCVDAEPSTTTTYTLTAEGAVGGHATRELTVTVGPAPARIIEVQVSTVQLKRGDTLSICYKVENAQLVQIEPIRYRAAGKNEGCTTDSPQRTTTYVVTATGAEGAKDQERVTVTVR